ncbi:MAG TPA: O-antigen ligase family protein, partial [Candidatus Dormibacteraeota bacterium]|nr:O-antigen ligase family protein [Candidatus Dormibacteraeota bacterium]
MSIGVGDWTLNSRTYLWKSTLHIIRDSPVFGTGVASWQWVYPKYRHPQVRTHTDYTHNDYLNLFSDYGAVGFLLMLWVFVAFFRHAVKTSDARLPSEERSWTVGAVVGVTAVLVHSIFDFNLHIPGNAFALAVVMGSTAAIADPDGKFPRAPLPGWARGVLGCSLLVICGLLGWQFGKAALSARYNRLGIEARTYRRDDPDVAYDYFARSVAVDPRFPTPHYQMGELLRVHAQGRRGEDKKPDRLRLAKQGVGHYAIALGLNPMNSEVLLRAANADELAGDDAAALKKYLRAVELDPESGINHLKLAQFYRDHDNPELALKHFETTSRLAGTSDPVIDLNIYELRELL